MKLATVIPFKLALAAASITTIGIVALALGAPVSEQIVDEAPQFDQRIECVMPAQLEPVALEKLELQPEPVPTPMPPASF